MSTAKSMATLYLNGKRNATTSISLNNKSGTLGGCNTTQQRFKSSTSNLAQSSIRQPSSNQSNNCCGQLQAAGTKSRLKSTSMTNLVAGELQQPSPGNRMQRPVSRNALDSIHNGMNAKYAQVQSKVYLKNIKPTAPGVGSKIPGSKSLAQQQQQQQQPDNKQTPSSRLKLGPSTAAAGGPKSAPQSLASERSLLVAKVRVLEDELASQASERENLRLELEREKTEKSGQVQELKQELQDKLAEHDRQNEEYHKKLLEAYELADQNRRAADSVLSESRQRDEESRKRIELLEGQLSELKEFVSMKEELMGKMFELREQLRQERERYEEQLKSLHQVFENEKLSREESMLLHSMNKPTTIKLDENSNYFNRMKPNLESSESINKQPYTSTGCRQCQSGSSQLHKSDQDMYGSKMSTRMQDTARSAWKASRKFAGSVITGGVNLSACGQCTKRTGSSSPSPPASKVTGLGFNCAPSTPSPCNEREEETSDEAEARHTSVIQVGPAYGGDEPAGQQPPAQRHRLASARQQQQPEAGDAQQQPGSLIRVDENNKLTIVTKFNDSECQANGGPEMGASSSVSERSRCESSSSGRGTSSDAGSAASQDGDDETAASSPKRPQVSAAGGGGGGGDEPRPNKGHRRRSSLFKASRVFGGSQVSLHKLKSLFGGSKGVLEGGKPASKEQPAPGQQQVPLDHLEASRLRCMELNSAITASSPAQPTTGPSADAELPPTPPATTTSTSHISPTNEPTTSEEVDEAAKVATTPRQEEERAKVGQGTSGTRTHNVHVGRDASAEGADKDANDYQALHAHLDRPSEQPSAIMRLASSVAT